MKLIIGLGNPGKSYELTRHNIGFIVLDQFAKYLKVNINHHKFKGDFVKTKYQDYDLVLLKPQTYMNLSGDCVTDFIRYFKINSRDILIIHDEVDLAFGRIQFKNTGSAAGHNGLKDIFNKTKCQQIMRLRIGVGRNEKISTADWVLSNFKRQELVAIDHHQDLLLQAVMNWITVDNFNILMTKFNNQQF